MSVFIAIVDFGHGNLLSGLQPSDDRTWQGSVSRFIVTPTKEICHGPAKQHNGHTGKLAPTNFTTVLLGQTPPNSPAQTVVDDGAAGTLTVFGANRASVDNTNASVAPHGAAGTAEVTGGGAGIFGSRAPTVSMSVLRQPHYRRQTRST